MIARTAGYTIYTTNAFRHLSAFLKKGRYDGFFILCDENTLSSCMAILLTHVPELSGAEVVELESGEENKCLEVCAGIWQTMVGQEASKKALLVNLGGGVVCDMGGFCASLYKRGIDFIHVPTSLLAMADASIGGKNGVDMLNIKNVLGTFAFPAGVFIDTGFLATLPERHLQNGLAEIFKVALVANAGLFTYLERHGGASSLQKLIDSSVRIKNTIVAADPKDKACRKALNFGHSIGHALEGLALERKDDLLHGEAVVAGMIMESHIAHEKRMLGREELERIVSLLLGHFGKAGIPFEAGEITKFLKNDKKNQRGEFMFALPTGIGKVKWDIPVKSAEVGKAVRFYHSLSNDPA